jgi:hypothetical protein
VSDKNRTTHDVPHPMVYVLEEMIERDWRFSDLCEAAEADAVDRAALEMCFLVQGTNVRWGVMNERLDRAFGASPGFFAGLEKQWLDDQTDEETK